MCEVSAERNYARRAMRDCRKRAKQNAAALQAEWDALPDVPRTIEAHGRAKL